jgi:NAD(P)-dependent dehydrogenase (short-subunit alcohol dehydrogenase family)
VSGPGPGLTTQVRADEVGHPFSRAVAVVTGASRGIGRAVAVELARRGAAVVVAARGGTDLEELTTSIRDEGGRAVPVRCDVSVEADLGQLAKETLRAFGPASVLVNSAGAYRVAPFLEATMDDFRHVMEVNFLATVSAIRTFLPDMVAARYGRIVNIASTAGKYGSRNQSMYNASKHAVVGLTRCLGLELAASGVRVNAVCPGFVDTPMLRTALPDLARVNAVSEDAALDAAIAAIPIGRLIRPEEVAHLAVYLASDEADGITGQAYTIAGGQILI